MIVFRYEEILGSLLIVFFNQNEIPTLISRSISPWVHT